MFLKCPPWLNRCLTICIFFVASFEPSNFSALNPIRPQMFDDLPSGYPATSAQHQPLPSSNRVTASSLYPAPMLMSTSIRQLADFEFSQLSGGSSTDNYNESGLPASREKSILAVRNCPTPLSLMLHSSYGAQRMHELARQIIRSDLTTSTYRQILEDLKKGDCPDPNTIVVSLDDLGSSWLRPDFKSMIKAFTDRDLVLVVGVIVRGPQDPVIWAYLRGLEAQGIEVASHTIDHYNLPLIEQEAMVEQVAGSYRVVCENLRRCPVTLILPFGNYDEEGRIMATATDYTFVVGIQGGLTFRGYPPYYLGRIPPNNNNQGITLYLLRRTFPIGRQPRAHIQ